MKIKKLVITAVIPLTLIIGIVAGWYFFRAPDNAAAISTDWISVPSFSGGVLSSEGYYFMKGNLLDIQKGSSIHLCFTAGCSHNDENTVTHS